MIVISTYTYIHRHVHNLQVRRKPDFYLWNVVVTMILLELMSLASYVLDPHDTEGISGRIGLALTLVLTCGIYRSANAQVSVGSSQPA